MRSSLVPFAVLFPIILFAGLYFIPWTNVQWGNLAMKPAEVVTVTGQAKTQQKTQVATFTAGVGAVNTDKDAAVKEVNEKIEEIIASVKRFGITDADIRTQNMSIYQDQEQYYDQDSQSQRSRPGQWRVNNTIEVKLRNIDDASEFASLLASSGATNVWGPNFSLEDTTEAENTLLKDAIDDARKKAETIANASGKKLGEILTVNEGGTSGAAYPMYAFEAGGGGGAPVEPGSQTVSKTVTVTFELN